MNSNLDRLLLKHSDLLRSLISEPDAAKRDALNAEIEKLEAEIDALS